MIVTQTLVFEGCEEEREALSSALNMIAEKKYDEAAKILVSRLDILNRDPVLGVYDQRSAAH